MAVARSSAFHAVSQLSGMGYVNHEKFGPIALSAMGRDTAETLTSRFETIEQFFIHVLNVDEAIARLDACAIEHILSPDTLTQMAARI